MLQGLHSTLEGIRLLIVEDCVDSRNFMKRLLRDTGCLLEMATDGREGVEMALGNHYHAVFMDIRMPRLDGYAATAELRNKGYKLPIIALSADVMCHDPAAFAAAGFTGIVAKPIADFPNFIKTIRQYATL